MGVYFLPDNLYGKCRKPWDAELQTNIVHVEMGKCNDDDNDGDDDPNAPVAPVCGIGSDESDSDYTT